MRAETSKTYSYINSLIHESSLQLEARENAKKLGRDAISLSPVEASILRLLAFSLQPRKMVEVGTLTGLSALYLAEALVAGGELWTFEKESQHASLARPTFSSAMTQSKSAVKIHLVEGDARESLPTIEKEGPFDLVFIDANKAAYIDYMHWAQKNLRVGGLIVADNVFLGGSVWGDSEGPFSAKQTQVMQDFNRQLLQDSQYMAAILPTDEGLLVACKR